MPYNIDLSRGRDPQEAGKALADMVAQRATCPTCGAECKVYHDNKRTAYYQRHPNGRGKWCKMSGKKVTR